MKLQYIFKTFLTTVLLIKTAQVWAAYDPDHLPPAMVPYAVVNHTDQIIPGIHNGPGETITAWVATSYGSTRIWDSFHLNLAPGQLSEKGKDGNTPVAQGFLGYGTNWCVLIIVGQSNHGIYGSDTEACGLTTQDTQKGKKVTIEIFRDRNENGGGYWARIMPPASAPCPIKLEHMEKSCLNEWHKNQALWYGNPND